MGVLIPLYRFYPSIESFLEGVVKSTIDHAADNDKLEPIDVQVLKTKPRRILKAAELAPKTYLETQDDIEAYLDKLRKALESAITNNERVEIR